MCLTPGIPVVHLKTSSGSMVTSTATARWTPATLFTSANISAALTVTGNEAIVSYRFFGEVSPPLSEIVATVNGQALPEPNKTSYPDRSAKAAILLMLDKTGRGREQQGTTQQAQHCRTRHLGLLAKGKIAPGFYADWVLRIVTSSDALQPNMTTLCRLKA